MHRTRHGTDRTVSSDSLYYADSLEKGKNGMKKDIPEATKYYERAVEEGNAQAMYKLARILETGAGGVQKNVKRSNQLYRAAASRGIYEAICHLDCKWKKVVETREKDVRKAAQKHKRNSTEGSLMKNNGASAHSWSDSDDVNTAGRHGKVPKRNARVDDGRMLPLNNATHRGQNAKRVDKTTQTSSRGSRNSSGTQNWSKQDTLTDNSKSTNNSRISLKPKKKSRYSAFTKRTMTQVTEFKEFEYSEGATSGAKEKVIRETRIFQGTTQVRLS